MTPGTLFVHLLVAAVLTAIAWFLWRDDDPPRNGGGAGRGRPQILEVPWRFRAWRRSRAGLRAQVPMAPR